MRRNVLFFILQACMVLLFTACEHRELTDLNTGHYVRIYLDEQIKNVTYGFYDESLEKPEYHRPNAMRVLLTDPQSGHVVSERFLHGHGEDERGYYIDGYIGAEAGTYNLLAYDFGSSLTLIHHEDNFYKMQAYTEPIGEYYLQFMPSSRLEMDEKSIVHQPEHLFHTFAQPIVIPETCMIDTLRNEAGDFFTAHSVVKSYYLQVRIKGAEWVKSAVSTVSGMAGGTLLHGCEQLVTDHPVNLFFMLDYKDKQTARGNGLTATLYTTFNTFGKLPDEENVLTLAFEFIKEDGSSQVETLILTDEFESLLGREHQHLIIDHEIVIAPPDGGGSVGGMTPGVDGWKEDDVLIQIG